MFSLNQVLDSDITQRYHTIQYTLHWEDSIDYTPEISVKAFQW